MKKILFALITAILLTGAAAASGQQELTIKKGQTRTFDHGRISIKFIKVLEDSRCPMNARCVWAGNAKIELKVWKRGGASKTIELNSTMEPQKASAFGYTFDFQDLRPQKGDPRPSKTTTAVITVARDQ